MIGWDQWRTLLAVFRHGTFTHAARALAVDATTVGRRLKMLESELGYELFIRENDRLFPTHRCESLLSHVETAEDALREAEQELANGELGAVWREFRMTGPPFLITNLFAPAVARFASRRQVRVELIATESKAIFSRREADIAIRIADRPQEFRRQEFRAQSGKIDAEQIGGLRYAVYRAGHATSDDLPWAGLIERHVQTTGSQVMMDLAGAEGFRFQAHHFATLIEFAASGVAQAMLPRVVADGDPRLRRCSETVLEQPLWMLSHRPDRDVLHLKAARQWIKELAAEKLGAQSPRAAGGR